MADSRVCVHLLPTLDENVTFGLYRPKYKLWWAVARCGTCKNYVAQSDWRKAASQALFGGHCVCGGVLDVVEVDWFEDPSSRAAQPSTPPATNRVTPIDAPTPKRRKIVRIELPQIAYGETNVLLLEEYGIAFSVLCNDE